jgi:hypothetical protein
VVSGDTAREKGVTATSRSKTGPARLLPSTTAALAASVRGQRYKRPPWPGFFNFFHPSLLPSTFNCPSQNPSKQHTPNHQRHTHPTRHQLQHNGRVCPFRSRHEPSSHAQDQRKPPREPPRLSTWPLPPLTRASTRPRPACESLLSASKTVADIPHSTHATDQVPSLQDAPANIGVTTVPQSQDESTTAATSEATHTSSSGAHQVDGAADVETSATTANQTVTPAEADE